MKYLFALFVLTALSLAVSARNLIPIKPHSKVISLDLERRLPTNIPAYESRRRQKRDGTVEVTLENQKTLYFANVSLGTPPQQLRLHIDTGSSDLWTNTANSTLCRRFGCEGGTYKSASSSTLQVLPNKFNITYMDGSSASGSYVADTLLFGDVTMEDFQFGLGERSTSSQGVLGIGYVGLEMQALRTGQAYANLPLALVNGGHIARNAYSLWLNDYDADTGTILFGGVNTARYQGDLATLPIIQDVRGGFIELAVALDNVVVNGKDAFTSNGPIPALLDTGSTLTYLPQAVAETIYSEVGAVIDSGLGYATAPCELKNQPGTVDFEFSGKVISVGLDELLVDIEPDSQGRSRMMNGKRACWFGIATIEGDQAVLGDTFLRSAYVVYDLHNNEISIAQTIFNTTDNNVEEIPPGTGVLPGAVRTKDVRTNGTTTEDAQTDDTQAEDNVAAASDPPKPMGSGAARNSLLSLVSMLAVAFAAGLFSY